MVQIRVGGVPEHFNLPWHLAIEEGRFSEKNIAVQWADFKGGTGAMSKALLENKADVCVMLTEGTIAKIVEHQAFKIISKYVDSPLVWGIHSAKENPLNDYKDIYSKNYAISRKGSGSHLMAIVDAYAKREKIDDSQWHIIKNLEGALASLQKKETDVFYWEKYTTKPYVDKGILKRIGEYATPWPCFVIAANNSFIQTHPLALKEMLNVIHRANYNFMHYPGAVSKVSERYAQSISDVEEWFHSTHWSTTPYLAEKTIKNVLFALEKASIIKEKTHQTKSFFYHHLF